jgi:hypothetical protein
MHFKSEQFHWQEMSKTYVAEASELGLAPGTHAGTTVSINGMDFYYTSTDYDASGEDIAGWRYKPTMATLQKSPVFVNVRVLIIND